MSYRKLIFSSAALGQTFNAVSWGSELLDTCVGPYPHFLRRGDVVYHRFRVVTDRFVEQVELIWKGVKGPGECFLNYGAHLG